MGKRIGYGKLGRSIGLERPGDRSGQFGGDIEPPRLLRDLAEKYPQHTFVIIGRNSGEVPQEVGLPSNVENPWTELRKDVRKFTLGWHSPLTWPERNSWVPFTDALVTPLFRELDGMIAWAGQHSPTNTPIPEVGQTWNGKHTKPQDTFLLYGSYLTRGISAWRNEDPLNREEIWLVPDPRNRLKMRDLKWPPRLPILSQFDFARGEKHERYSDRRSPTECGFEGGWDNGSDHVWTVQHRYVYSRLEICGVTPKNIDDPGGFPDNFHERKRFGMFINEADPTVKNSRLRALRDWVFQLNPDWIHGHWTKKTSARLLEEGRVIEPLPVDRYYDQLRATKCTFTTPSSGSGWATTKPWESFSTGTVCFFHPDYDTQGHIIPARDQDVESPTLRWLRDVLRPKTPVDLRARVDQVANDHDLWLAIATAQRKYYDWACNESWHIKLMAERLGL